jgi:hypothetical protein
MKSISGIRVTIDGSVNDNLTPIKRNAALY